MIPEYSQIIPNLLGDHPTIVGIIRTVAKISASKSSVLIMGETGTGKELVARGIHNNSQQSDKPFIILNCAGIPENQIEKELFGYESGNCSSDKSIETGIFEMANGGTVFLKDVPKLSVHVQSKLSRVLQDKQFYRLGGKSSISVDIRFISSTTKELESEIKCGSFREDLYYRLNVIKISIPPLRERGKDITLLTTSFIQHFSRISGLSVDSISSAALQMLRNYNWPGNVRQLESVIERSVLMANKNCIEPDDLPDEISNNQANTSETTINFMLPANGINFEEFEKSMIEQAMERSDGVIGKAAPLLGMTYKTLQYRLEKFGIKRKCI